MLNMAKYPLFTISSQDTGITVVNMMGFQEYFSSDCLSKLNFLLDLMNLMLISMSWESDLQHGVLNFKGTPKNVLVRKYWTIKFYFVVKKCWCLFYSSHKVLSLYGLPR